MNKRIIAAALSASMVLSSMPFVIADDDKVEIAFKVGDSILKINGVDTEVETPYVAGEGVTLVPLRVITEAFGAEVDWDGDTKTITLTYPDVNILLQIDNKIATINDHKETLLEAPALSENGVTMVPLRFISETFGAEVGYDADTQAILVTKEKVGDAPTVTGITDMARTGDSYYKWSIDTPVEMKMTDRSLDGLSTAFTADDGSNLYIDIYKYTEDSLKPFDEEFSRVKDTFSNYTLSEAEKLTDTSGNQYMHFLAKNKNETVDFREYYGKDMTNYEIISSIDADDDGTVKNMILSVADSFRLGSIDSDTYDLSTVEDDMRVIKNDTYKYSFKVPADYVLESSEDTENEVTFVSPDSNSHASVSLGIYSKSNDVTALSLAKKDHDHRVEIMNPEFSNISDVTGSEEGSYLYTHEIKGSSKNDKYLTDTFFEKGDYVYNMSVSVNSIDDLTLSDLIISSLNTEELDSAVIGKLLRNDLDYDTMTSRTVSSYKFSLPASWKTVSSSPSSADLHTGVFLNASTGSMLSVMVSTDSKYTKGNLSSVLNEYSKYATESKNHTLLGNIEYKTIEGQRFGYFTYEMNEDNLGKSYCTVYAKTDSKELIMFSLYEKDIYYHKNGNNDILAALSTLEKK